MARRVSETLRAIRGGARGKKILIVSHNLAISAGLAVLLGDGPEKFRKYRQEPCAINRLSWGGEAPALTVCNDYSFLPERICAVSNARLK